MLDGMHRMTGSGNGTTMSPRSGAPNGSGITSTITSAPSEAVAEGQQSGSRWASSIFGGSGSGSMGHSRGSGSSSGSGDQDLSGNDLKFIVWAIVFTKPGYETVLEPQQNDLLNYPTDGSTS